MRRHVPVWMTAAAAAVAAPAAVQAAHLPFTVDIGSLNDSGVSGEAFLEFRAEDGERINTEAGETADDLTDLFVRITASGFEPNQLVPAHIHGLFDTDGDGDANPFAAPSEQPGSTTFDSTVPTLAETDGSDVEIPDAFGNPTGELPDGDGFIEVIEGRITYGPIILPFLNNASEFELGTDDDINDFRPTADEDGNFNFVATFDLSDDTLFFNPVTGETGFTADDLFPLNFREIVLHGMTLEDGDGANGGEADGTAGFKGTLPVAAGEIQVVPTPTAGVMGLALLGGLGLMRRRRRTA